MSSTRIRPLNNEEPYLRHAQAFESQFKELFHHNTLLSPHARLAFETLEKVGEGGMGAVYRILDKRLGREAALKLLILPEDSDHPSHAEKMDLARERFLREAEITARLDHPAIPPVYEAGMATDGRLYMLMRLIRGETLSEKVRAVHEGGEGTVRDLLEILVRVGEAVAYAHEQGVIHRDLKPSNIMVGNFGEVMVMDWGIAKELKRGGTRADRILRSVLSQELLAEAGLTMAGAVVGTLGYMAPEQIDGGKVKAQSDVFSLGLILVELMIGRRAIAGDTAVEQVVQTMSGDFQNFVKYRDQLPKEIEWIVVDALKIDQEQRTKSALLFSSRLKAYLQGQEVPGFPYSKGDLWKRKARANAGYLVFATTLMFFLTVLVTVFLSLENEKQRSRAIEAQRQLAERGQVLEQRRREDAEAKTLETVGKLGVVEAERKRMAAVLDLFSQARVLIRRGSPSKEVDDKIQSALEKAKRGQDALMTAAQLYVLRKNYPKAIKLFEECVERFPPGYLALFEISQIGALIGDNDLYANRGIKRILEISRARGEKNEHTYFAEGMTLSEQGKTREAIEAYSKAESYSKNIPLMYYNRSALWENLKEYRKALSDIDRFVELKPEDSRGYEARGSLMRARGLYDQSIADFDKAFRFGARGASFYYNRAYTWELKRVAQKALNDYSKAIALEPKVARYYAGRGGLYMKLGRFPNAEADMNKAIALKPNISNYYVNRGNVRGRLGKIDEGIADFEQALRLNPKDGDCHVYMGSMYMAKNQVEAAFKQFNAALSIDINNEKALYSRGQIYQMRGGFDQAQKDYDRALQLNPRFAAAYLMRGDLYFVQKRLGLALKDYNCALDIQPNDCEGLYCRGNVYMSLGRNKDAQTDFIALLRLNPNYRYARQVRKSLASIQRSLQGK